MPFDEARCECKPRRRPDYVDYLARENVSLAYPHLHLASAAQEVQKAQQVLEATILSVRRDGMSLREIAKHTNMSHERVRRIVSPQNT